MSSHNAATETENLGEAEPSLPSTIFTRLDQALQRVRILRRDILQAEQQDFMSRSSRSRISPGHEAILLTGHDGYLDDLERMRTIIPADTLERLRQLETRRAEVDREGIFGTRDRAYSHSLRDAVAAHMHPLDTSISPSSSHPSSAQSPLSFASPLSPPRQRLLPNRLLDSAIQPLRRRELSDDPHTEIGRRVAARENARRAQNSSRDGTYRLSSVMERDFEYANRTRPHRSEPALAPPLQASLDQVRREVENRISRSLDAVGALRVEPSARPNRGSRNQSHQSSNSSTNLPSASSTQSRLSLLSNFPVQNFPTPSSTLSNPPLLFEDPTSYDDSMQSINEEEQRAFEDNRWDSRAERNLLFTSSPVQMNPEPEVVRAGHHRDNTAQLPVPSRQPLHIDANGDEVRHEEPARSRPSRSSNESPLGLYPSGPMRRYATDEHPHPSIRALPLDSNVISSPVTHDHGDGAYYYTLLSDGTKTSEPKQPTFGTNVPRYIDPLPSTLVDKLSRLPERRARPALRISTSTSYVTYAGR